MAGELSIDGSLSGDLSTPDGLTGNLNIPRIIEQTNYEQLSNLPQIENVTLIGNMTHDDLKLHSLSNAELEALLTL